MDSTPAPPHPPPVGVKASATITKLPIKRKTPDSSTITAPHPDPYFDPNPNFLCADDPVTAADVGVRQPPFKFHRIWTEPDEIRFLQGLLDSASDGLVFPKDLNLFYERFSTAMSQPYSKSQQSEKLRRLRKKFRAISSRLARGLDAAVLSPHDRALYDLSKKLWSPEFSPISPFVTSSGQAIKSSSKINSENDSIGVNQNELGDPFGIYVDGDDHNKDGDYDKKLGESNVDGEQKEDVFDRNFGGLTAKTVLEVLDQSLKEVKMALVWQGIHFPYHNPTQSSREGSAIEFGRRWQEQRALEFDVFAKRLKLVLENTLLHKP
ncbi:hypothetical protein L6164_030813 [Bauhinia variegata]|uniref:Uncharacterized protein n=1 Tax=Bauhinia variegata TaxID=167791 RepID=A0ACB9LDY8_BAUVA|nr:hypothetical protein L6164_030813 [Bauhinia variegata]